MFTSFWELQFNPFAKSAQICFFESEDFQQANARLSQLVDLRGIGLFTGASGTGKTFALKQFIDALNPARFHCVYLPLSTLTVLEFYRSLAFSLGLVPQHKKIDLFRSIQERIVSLHKDKRIIPVILLDEAQYLNTKILNDLKILMNFQMDSQHLVALILAGQPILNNTLSMQAHEALAQRIIINYTFHGLSKAELASYLSSRLQCAGVSCSMFTDNAVEALFSCSGASPRMVNLLAEKALLLGCQKKIRQINSDLIMLAQNEISLT